MEFRIVWTVEAGRLAGCQVHHTPVFASARVADAVRRCQRSADLMEVVPVGEGENHG